MTKKTTATLPARRMAILTFALPEDDEAFRAASRAESVRSALFLLSQEWRGLAKYGEGEDAERARWARARLLDALGDEGADL